MKPLPFLLVLLLVGSAHAAADPSSQSRISAAGKKRIKENLEILDRNLKNAENNLTASSKNKETVQAELDDLDKLGKQYEALKQKYTSYLTGSDQEIKKNESALSALEIWEKKAQNAPERGSDAFKQKWDSVEREKAQRLQWKKDSEAKIKRVGELMTNLLKNLRDLDSRKGPLKRELADWSSREKEYQKTIEDMKARKAKLERVAKE